MVRISQLARIDWCIDDASYNVDYFLEVRETIVEPSWDSLNDTTSCDSCGNLNCIESICLDVILAHAPLRDSAWLRDT